MLDGNSTDDTHAIAKHYGARVLPQSDSMEPNFRITDFSAVRNRGIAAARYPWFLFVDSDEYLSAEVVAEIRAIVARGGNADTLVYRMPRKYVVQGVVIERSSMYPNYQVRFFYLPAVDGFVKPVHEKIRVKDAVLVGALHHATLVPFDDRDEILAKWKRYAEHQIAERPVTLLGLPRYTALNLFEFLKYVMKYLRTFFGSGARMPFVFERHNALYHLRLIALAWQGVIKHED